MYHNNYIIQLIVIYVLILINIHTYAHVSIQVKCSDSNINTVLDVNVFIPYKLVVDLEYARRFAIRDKHGLTSVGKIYIYIYIYNYNYIYI